MKKLSLMSLPRSLKLLRVTVGLLLAAHGFMRLGAGTVDDFGEFLNARGFMIGTAIAWFLTLFEMAGGILMAIGFFVKWIALVFMTEIAMGIILVHANNGWFVVGHQTGGVEYSVLILASLLVISASAKKSNRDVMR